MKSLLPVIGIFFLIIVPISFAIFDEIINILFWCLIWLYVLYRARGLMKSPEEKKQVIEDAIDSVRTKVAENQIDDIYTSCMKRDRTQSFDDWISLAIQGMAIDEIEKEKLDQELVAELKETWKDSWEVMYPTARVQQELSLEDSYWTALRKFDEKAETDLSKG